MGRMIVRRKVVGYMDRVLSDKMFGKEVFHGAHGGQELC